MNRSFLIFVLIFIFHHTVYSGDISKGKDFISNQQCVGLDGSMFQFLPDNSSLPVFTLIFRCSGDQLTGFLIGPSEDTEHGLFFFKANLNKLKIDGSNNIEFEITKGNLYRDHITPYNYKETYDWEPTGISNSKFSFKGKLESQKITLNCFSENANCLKDIFVFELIR